MPVSYEDFKKLDLRVAKIVSVEKIPGKTKIVKGVVDLGSEKRDVIIGGAEFYQPEELVGKTVIVVANLEPKKLAGVESNAMLLAADVNNKPYWLTVTEVDTLATVQTGTLNVFPLGIHVVAFLQEGLNRVSSQPWNQIITE